MKKQIIAIAFLIATANNFGQGLNSYMSEITSTYNNELDTTEVTWTAGEGSYKINEKYSFGFIVDRIYTSDSNRKDRESINTEFSLYGWKNINEDWNLYTTYSLYHNSGWNEGSQDGYWYQDLYYASAYFGRNYKVKDKNYYVGIKLDQQFGGNVEDSFSNSLKPAMISGINFFAGTQITDNLKVDLSQYNLLAYNEGTCKFDLWYKGDMTLEHTIPLKNGFSIFTEAYVEATKYNRSDIADGSYVLGYVIPKLKYEKNINDKVKLHSSLGYELISFYHWTGSANNGWNNNKVELITGFTYKP